jgi:2-iminobutanoate/2-iminopropanoate deaminase
MIKREVVMAPAGGPSHGKGMVQGIKAGGFIFFSAIRGNHPVTNHESSDTKEQARQAFENLKVLLGAAGAGLEHVVKVTLYLHDLRYLLPFHEIWLEYSPNDPAGTYRNSSVADANAQLSQIIDQRKRSLDIRKTCAS